MSNQLHLVSPVHAQQPFKRLGQGSGLQDESEGYPLQYVHCGNSLPANLALQHQMSTCSDEPDGLCCESWPSGPENLTLALSGCACHPGAATSGQASSQAPAWCGCAGCREAKCRHEAHCALQIAGVFLVGVCQDDMNTSSAGWVVVAFTLCILWERASRAVTSAEVGVDPLVLFLLSEVGPSRMRGLPGTTSQGSSSCLLCCASLRAVFQPNASRPGKS